jgi:hypothetical protein
LLRHAGILCVNLKHSVENPESGDSPAFFFWKERFQSIAVSPEPVEDVGRKKEDKAIMDGDTRSESRRMRSASPPLVRVRAATFGSEQPLFFPFVRGQHTALFATFLLNVSLSRFTIYINMGFVPDPKTTLAPQPPT